MLVQRYILRYFPVTSCYVTTKFKLFFVFKGKTLQYAHDGEKCIANAIIDDDLRSSSLGIDWFYIPGSCIPPTTNNHRNQFEMTEIRKLFLFPINILYFKSEL